MQEYFQKIPSKYKYVILASLVLIILIIFIVAYKYFNSIDSTEEIVTNEVKEENIIETPFEFGAKKSKIIVHIVGEVNNPGVVTLDEGARIIDAIKAAGDKTEDADLSKINLAYIIEDGTQIYVPRVGEDKEEFITEDAGDGIVMDSSNAVGQESKDIKVNINTASIDKLITLPGIGNSTAQKIIDYRNENGKFSEIADLKNVPGIGESKFNTIKDLIIVK